MILSALGLLATALSSSLLSGPTASGFNSAGINSYSYGNGFYTTFDYDIINDNLNGENFYFTDSETGNRYTFARTMYLYDSQTQGIMAVKFVRTQDFTNFFQTSNFTCFGIFRFLNSSNTTLNTLYTKPFVLDDYGTSGVDTYYKLYPYDDLTYTYSQINGYIPSGTRTIRIVFYWTFSNITPSSDSYDAGYNKGFDDGFYQGFDSGSREGFDDGKTQGIQEGYEDGYSLGRTEGIAEGREQVIESGQTASIIFNGIISVGLLPTNVFLQMLNLEVFGINIGALVSSLLTIMVIIIIGRMLFGGKSEV